MPQMIAPPSSPMLALPVTSQAESKNVQLAAAGRVEPDDIPDPQTPTEALPASKETRSFQPPTPAWVEHEALLQGFLGHLQAKLEKHALESHRAADNAVQELCTYIKGWVEGVLDKRIADAEGAKHLPYTVSISALAPQGFAVTFTIAKPSQQEVGAELMDVVQRLAENGFRPLQ